MRETNDRTVENPATSPTLPKQRLLMIDSLRGYALMGLFLVHMVEYFELYWYKMPEAPITGIIFGMFGGKAYALFALLFGISFQLLFSGSAAAGRDFVPLMSRRFGILLLLGIIHTFFYSGEILQILAIAGFILLLLYRLPTKALLIISAICLLQIPGVIYTALYIVQHRTDYIMPLHWPMYGPVYEAYVQDSYLQTLYMMITLGNAGKWMFMLESGRLFTMLGLILLGYCLSKNSFFTVRAGDVKKYGLYLSASLAAAAVLYIARPHLDLLFQTKEYWMTRFLLDNYRDLLYVFVSLFGFAFLYQLPFVHKILSLLAPAGRMSLTLYVAQSIVFVPFFYGYGLGAWEWIGQNNSFIIGAVCWILQVFFANWWFRHFAYGPLEWVWRSATYGKKVAMRK